MYESIQPFLKTLKNLDPARFPLRKYLVHTGLESVEIGPPAYARNFEWDLSVLLRDSNVRCSLNPSKPASIASAREVMKACGKLDPSQSDAVIDSLTREIALIQGPPGTGKTFTAVELLRVLFANNAGPVLLLAFTNHALDHILRSIHDGEVTRDIVRLGSRSKDEVISEYSLESVSRARGKDKLTGVANHCFKVVKEMEQVGKYVEFR
jgi:superfamily I DNA and/or RNA helicase